MLDVGISLEKRVVRVGNELGGRIASCVGKCVYWKYW